jgi:hypothetical protein
MAGECRVAEKKQTYKCGGVYVCRCVCVELSVNKVWVCGWDDRDERLQRDKDSGLNQRGKNVADKRGEERRAQDGGEQSYEVDRGQCCQGELNRRM